MIIHLNTSSLVVKDLSAIVLNPLPWRRVTSTSFKLASTLDAHLNEEYDNHTMLCVAVLNKQPSFKFYRGTCLAKTRKTKLFHGTPIILSNHKLSDELEASLKLSTCVGISPYFRLAKGKRIPVDRVCSKLQVSYSTTLSFFLAKIIVFFFLNQDFILWAWQH